MGLFCWLCRICLGSGGELRAYEPFFYSHIREDKEKAVERKTSKAWQVVEPVVEAMGYEFVGAEYVQQDRRNTLRIFIDRPEGITLDDCSAVSHQLSGVLDVENPIEGTYDLEVSSPGLDRPLFKAEDFGRFAGQTVKIRLTVPQAGRRNFTGILLGLEDDKVRVEVDKQVFELPFGHIERAKVIPLF